MHYKFYHEGKKIKTKLCVREKLHNSIGYKECLELVLCVFVVLDWETDRMKLILLLDNAPI